MKAFDLIDSVSFGYHTVWRERRYLLKLAMVPVLIKIICAVTSYYIGYGDFYLRQALISLPAAFAEGWLIAQFLRTLLLLERWPIMLDQEPNEQQMGALLLRARGIMSSTITFALISYLGYGVKGVFMYFYEISAVVPGAAPGTVRATASPETSLMIFIVLITAFCLFINFFRYLWLNIPMVTLMPIKTFLNKTKGFAVSLKLIGICFVSVLPLSFMFAMVTKFLNALAGGAGTDGAQFVSLIVALVVDTVISLITTASMVYAFRGILPKHPKALPDINKE